MVVAGPTASGKSDLALRLAEAVGGRVINADSMQVYDDLRILTARPEAADLARAPHRLYGILPGRDICSVARWLDMAVAEIGDAWAAGAPPILIGGTGLYLQALREGLSPLPDIPSDIRAEARRLHAELGGAAFRNRLAERDPRAAARLPDGDGQRLIRAYEVVLATGRSLGDWQAERPPAPPLPGAVFRTLLLDPPRERLYGRVEARFDRMLAAGALDEVAALDARGLDAALPVMKAVGVPPLRAYLHGALSLGEARSLAMRDSRRYAKRQFTWFRHRMRPDAVFAETGAATCGAARRLLYVAGEGAEPEIR